MFPPREEFSATLLSNAALALPTLLWIADVLETEIDSSGMANRSSDHLWLLARSYEIALIGRTPEHSKASERILDVCGKLLFKVDTNSKRLCSILDWNARHAGDEDAHQNLQDEFTSEVDPVARLLNDCCKKAPVFGPYLEDMLLQMNALIASRDAFIKARGGDFKCVLFDDKFLATLILNAMSLDASVLSREMTLPGTLQNTYQFDWQRFEGFHNHPVVKEIIPLSRFLEGAGVSPEVLEPDLTNFLSCVANWCGEQVIFNAPAGITKPRTTPECNAVIFEVLFKPGRLRAAIEGCDEKGMSVLTAFVMEHHKATAHLLPHKARGKHLEAELGM